MQFISTSRIYVALLAWQADDIDDIVAMEALNSRIPRPCYLNSLGFWIWGLGFNPLSGLRVRVLGKIFKQVVPRVGSPLARLGSPVFGGFGFRAQDTVAGSEALSFISFNTNII